MAVFGKIREKLHATLQGDFDCHAVAGGFAVGVFFSFTPLVSFHMLLAFLVAVLFRLSKAAAMAGAWVNNYYTMPFVFYGCFRLGEWVLGVRIPTPSFEGMTVKTLLQAAVPYAAPLFLGTTIVGLFASVLAYLIVYRVAVGIQSARRTAQN
jgi:uncharacterized protein